MLGVPQSTIRFWEKEFLECSPRRNDRNVRYYTADDLDVYKIVHYLLKVKGLRIEAAKEQLRSNRSNVSKRVRIIEVLTDTRDDLQRILSSLEKRR